MLNPSAGSDGGPADGEGEGHSAGAGAEGGGSISGNDAEKGGEADAAGQGGDGSAGYVEFLPVEWFNEVRRLVSCRRSEHVSLFSYTHRQ